MRVSALTLYMNYHWVWALNMNFAKSRRMAARIQKQENGMEWFDNYVMKLVVLEIFKLTYEAFSQLDFNLRIFFHFFHKESTFGDYGSDNHGWARKWLWFCEYDCCMKAMWIYPFTNANVIFVILQTMPFMNLGIALLYLKPTKEPPSTFSFLSPFSIGVWVYLAVAYVTVSLCLFILGRLSPSEWVGGIIILRHTNIKVF